MTVAPDGTLISTCKGPSARNPHTEAHSQVPGPQKQWDNKCSLPQAMEFAESVTQKQLTNTMVGHRPQNQPA